MAGLKIETLADAGPVYGPETGDALPGIVILHGSEGPMAGWSHRFAAILAAQGCFAMPYAYGEGDFWAAGAILDVPLAPVLDAVDALAAHPRCAGAGLFGWSRGAEMALLLASLEGKTDRLPCVAAHAPSDTVNMAFLPGQARSQSPDAPRAWVWPEDATRTTPGARIEIERYPGPVFLSVGTADEIWDHRMTLRLAERLEAAGRPADLFVAEGQGHAFTFDREPELWQRLLAFFHHHLETGP